MRTQKILNWLDKYFSFVMFAGVFLIGLATIIFLKDSVYIGLLYCVTAIGASINNYIVLKKLTWVQIKQKLSLLPGFRSKK